MGLLFLMGMPGAGKTYWGRVLSAAYSQPFFDTDAMIEQQEGMAITQLFREKGEAYFRVKEKEVMLQLISREENAIVACGGGMPAWEDNMVWMKNAGCTVYLRADIDTLLGHLAREVNTRPLLASVNARETLVRLFEERKKVYVQADYILQVENLSLINFDQIIRTCINRL